MSEKWGDKLPQLSDEHARWRKVVEDSLLFLDRVPEQLQHHRPVIEKRTAQGVVVHCQPILLDLHECAVAGIIRPTHQLFWHYVIAKDEIGNLVGTNVSYVTERNGKLLIGSDVRVIDKGRGFATPISEVFQEEMQAIANRLGRPLTWGVIDGNSQKLLEYESSERPDPTILAGLRAEHQRWLALYGPGGKFGIVQGEKTFHPRP